MKSLPLLLVLVAAGLAHAADTAPVSTRTALPSGTWATVDSRSITKDEVLRKTKFLPAFVPEDERAAIVLDGMIDEIVLSAGLDRDGSASSVTDAEMEKLLDEQRQQAKRMGDDLDARLKAEGVTLDEVKAKLRVALAFKKRVEKDATDDALRAWFARHELEVAGQVRATQILIQPRAGSDDTATFQRAIQVLAKVKPDGSNLGQLARDLSDDKNAPLDSGDLDYFGAGAGIAPPEVVEASFARGKKGLVPKPVRSRRGYHIVFVTGTRFLEPAAFEKHRGQVQQRFVYERASELRKTWRAAARIELAPDAPRSSR
ncbi:MAG: peptidylprolyl isomerase [Planctomycetota bacterium]